MIRKILLSWLELFSSIPNVNLLNQMSRLLPPLLTYVADKDEDIRQGAQKQLEEFLSEFKALGENREASMDEEILKTLMNFYNRNEFREDIICRSCVLAWTCYFLCFLETDAQRELPASSGNVD
jgi:hypothetical protein